MEKNLFYIGKFDEGVGTNHSQEGKYMKEAVMFSTGVHRGVEYTEKDIEQLVKTFSANDDVPVQVDHSESARDTVGYIREVKTESGRLMGLLEIIDEEVQERINKGLMKKLSVSFYLKHTEEGFKPYKIREVSLVAFPQVKGARLFSENGYISNYEVEGDNEMPKAKEEFSKEVLEKAKELIEAELVEKYHVLEEKVEKLEEGKLATKISQFQEDKKIVPAQKESLEKLLGTFSEEQEKLFDEFMSNHKVVDLAEVGEVVDQDGSEDKRSKEQKDFDEFYEKYTQKHGKTL